MGRVAQPAADTLVETLEDEHDTVRFAAAEALWKTDRHHPRVPPALVGCLRSSRRSVRIAVIRLLDKMNEAALPALPLLKRLLENDRPQVRSAARKAIQKISADD
jgi:HEAT repeat protein